MKNEIVLLDVTCLTPQKQLIKAFCTDSNFETSLETLSQLVRMGWTLISVDYSCIGRDSALPLPIEAIDGSSLKEPMKKLEQEWMLLLKKKRIW
ncbi:hypothetical protein [Spirosoma panaciterrae]|uniref:hypothetical protein n=1 Tax=Spirosoma panaciterrae TaxID=496058 RepID=UPI00036B5FBF|nr:hypothetical protein [Spirosoma panaciterrae]